MTTREPGASDALTSGLGLRPRSTAFFASRPAASMTDGLLVLVQLVMAAMSTLPWRSRRPAGTRRYRSGVGRLLAISSSAAR